MTSPARRAVRAAVTAVVAVLVGPALAGSAAVAQAGTAVRTETTPTVTISITAISPTVLSPGTDLRVSATITNSGPAALAEPRLLVHLNRTEFVSRSSLDVWRNGGPYADLGTTVLTKDLKDPLKSGASRTVVLTVPAENVGLSSTAWSWGARGLGLQIVDVADPSRLRQGVARTFVVWYPSQTVEPTTVSVLVPITGPAPGADAAQQVATLAGGRLGDVLAATAGSAATWAVDPWLVDTAVNGTADLPEESADTAQQWGRTLLSAAESRDVALLPWGDADVTALVHDDLTEVLDLAERRSAADAAELGLVGTTEVVLPGESLPDLTTAAWAAEQDVPLVVGAGELPSPSVLTYTPSGQTLVATAGGDATVLVPDERLSSALTAGSVLGTATSGNPVPATGATAAADLLAELAVITRERPADGRHVLLAVPRDWQPDVEVARTALAELAGAPFVASAPLGTLAAERTAIERGTLPDQEASDSEVRAAELSTVLDAVDLRRQLAEMVERPDELVGDTVSEQLAPASLSWRADPTGRSALVAMSAIRTEALRAAITVTESSTVNLLSSDGKLPLQIDNALDQSVTLAVRLRPSDARLVARDTVEVVVPAGEGATVQLPVHGVQSANVQVAVELRTPGGQLVDDSTTVTVRVRAEWESIGTAVIAGILALGFVTGLVRTIRRGRRRRPSSATVTT